MKFVAFVVILITATLLRGFAFMMLFRWFFVPFGLPDIGIAWALGISSTVYFLTYDPSSDNDRDSVSTLIVATIGPIVALVLGYLYHGFM